MQQLASLPSPAWGLLLVPLTVLALRRPPWVVAWFFVAGVLWVSVRAGAILAEQLPAALEGRDLVVEGRVADIPRPADYGLRFELDVEAASADGAPVALPARVLLSVRGDAAVPRAGERWRFTVRLNRAHGLQNPGGFDYEAYLFQQRIRARGYVREAPPAERLDARPAPRYWIDQARERLGERLRALLGERAQAGVVVALANGDTRGVEPLHWEVFRRTGTLHLVAISGLHISLVAGVAFFLVRWLWAAPAVTLLRVPAPVAGALGALVAAAVYAALAGFVIPTQRALVMVAVAMGAILLRRRLAPSRLLAAALLAVLAYDPLAVMAAGFWLSFAAVAVIVFVMHADAGGASRWRRFGYLQWAIALGMLPLTLALFQQVSLVGPLANLVAVPVFDLGAVPLTLLGLVALGLAPDAVASACLHAAAWLLAALWPLLEWLAAREHAVWAQHLPPAWALACGALGAALLLAPRGWPARWVGAVWLLPLFLVRPGAPAPGEVWLTLLDVGQGLAAVVRTAGHTLVFDTGPRYGPNFDTGAAVVVPYLRSAGVGRVDTLVVSDGDNDHAGGVASLRAALPVARILTSVPQRLPGAEACAAGQEWVWDEVRFRVLAPLAGEGGRGNDAACVLQVGGRHGSVLLPGDIEARAERALVNHYREALASAVLIAPHHGSKSSSSTALVAAVRPRLVLFAVGYRNRHRHPHPAVVSRYAQTGAELLDSAASGAIEVRLGAGGPAVSRYRASARRYWFAD